MTRQLRAGFWAVVLSVVPVWQAMAGDVGASDGPSVPVGETSAPLSPAPSSRPSVVAPIATPQRPAAPTGERQRLEAGLRQQLRLRPMDRRLHAQLIDVLYQNRDWTPLLEAYRQAVKRFPRDVAFWQGLAEIAEAMNRPQEAVDARMKVLALDPKRALFWGGQSIGLLKQGRRPTAFPSR